MELRIASAYQAASIERIIVADWTDLTNNKLQHTFFSIISGKNHLEIQVPFHLNWKGKKGSRMKRENECL